MQQCGKCGSSVPDGRDTCQICFAKLEAGGAPVGPIGLQTPQPHQRPADDDLAPGIPGLRPAQTAQAGGIPGLYPQQTAEQEPVANYLSGSQQQTTGPTGGEMRVSLTGEVFEAPPSLSRPTGPAAYPGTAAGPGGRPGGSYSPPRGPARPAGRRSVAEAEEAPAKGNSLAAVFVLLIVLIGAGGAGGWWYWSNYVAPKNAVVNFMEAFKNKNWSGLYKSIEFPAESQAAMNESQFSMAMNMVGSMITLKEYSIEGVTPGDGYTTVKVKQTVELSGALAQLARQFGQGGSGPQTRTEDLKVIKKDGAWKIDGTALNQLAAAGRGSSGPR